MTGIIIGIFSFTFIGLAFLFTIINYPDEFNVKAEQTYENDRGIFYKHTDGIGIISSDPSKHYDEVSLLIPIESDNTCTFKKQFGYTWCADYFGDDGIRPYTVDLCVEQNFNGIRTTDGYCLEILVMDYVDDFNRAFKEQKLHFIDWKIFEEKQSQGSVSHD